MGVVVQTCLLSYLKLVRENVLAVGQLSIKSEELLLLLVQGADVNLVSLGGQHVAVGVKSGSKEGWVAKEMEGHLKLKRHLSNWKTIRAALEIRQGRGVPS